MKHSGCLVAFLFVFSFLQKNAIAQKLSDANASENAQKLYKNLLAVVDRNQYLVGHQDDLAYGVHWKYKKGRSDIKDVVGDYPAVYGWELSGIELGKSVNIDSVPFDKMRNYIREGHARGGVITISWHLHNPLNGATAWDTTHGSVRAILRDARTLTVFVNYLDKVADYLQTLTDKNGIAVPILFRPFHELTGNWFWWGRQGGSPEELQELFRFTVDYLRHERQLHNLIIVYNTSDNFQDSTEFLRGYPGNDYCDILSFDTYQYGSTETAAKKFSDNLSTHLELMQKIALQHRKIMSVAEMGFNQIPVGNWFTKTVAPVLNRYPVAYVLFWRNAGYKPNDGADEYYVPYKGHASAKDFQDYYQSTHTLFEKDWRKEAFRDK